jgi:hypothetical protein
MYTIVLLELLNRSYNANLVLERYDVFVDSRKVFMAALFLGFSEAAIFSSIWLSLPSWPIASWSEGS